MQNYPENSEWVIQSSSYFGIGLFRENCYRKMEFLNFYNPVYCRKNGFSFGFRNFGNFRSILSD